MPAPYKVLTTKVPYMSLSLCRKSDANGVANSVACQAFNIEQVAQVFQQLEIETGSFHVIHPYSDSLIYEKTITDYQLNYNWTDRITLNMFQSEQQFFLTKVQKIINDVNINQNNINYNDYVKSISKINGFEYNESGNSKYCLLLPIQIGDRVLINNNGNNKKETTFSNIMILLYVFRKDEMIQSYSNLFFILGNTFIANSIFYLILFVMCLLIVMYYSKRFSQLIELPIQSLIDKLKSLNLHLYEQNGLSSQDEIYVVFDNKYSRNAIYSHTCFELTKLEKYITNIQDIFNFNFNYNNNKVDETLALFTWIKAVKHFQSVDDYKALGSTLNNIANIHFNNQRYLEALDYYNQSLVCLEQEKCELLEGEKLQYQQQLQSECSYYSMHVKDDYALHNKSAEIKKLADSKKLQQQQQQQQQQQYTDNFYSSNHQLNTNNTRKKSGILPWLEKYLNKNYNSSSNHNINSSKLRLLKNQKRNLESLKFDRLFAYSQVLLSCCIDNKMECEITNSNKRFHHIQKKEYYHAILNDHNPSPINQAESSPTVHHCNCEDSLSSNSIQDSINHLIRQNHHEMNHSEFDLQNNYKNKIKNNININNLNHLTFTDAIKNNENNKHNKQQQFWNRRDRGNDEALLSQYCQVLQKLLKIAKVLDNDYNRYILIYLELSKAELIKNNIELSQKYLNDAFKNFLELFKRIKAAFILISNKPSSQSYSHYLQCLNQLLIKRFSVEEVNEEIHLNHQNHKINTPISKCATPAYHGNSHGVGTPYAFANGSASKSPMRQHQTSFSLLNFTSPSPSNQNNQQQNQSSQQQNQLRRKQSKGNINSACSASPIQNTPLNNIHPILEEDHLESQEEINLQKGTSQTLQQDLIPPSTLTLPLIQQPENNTIFVHLSKKNSSATAFSNVAQHNKNAENNNNNINNNNINIANTRRLSNYSPNTLFGTTTTEKNFNTYESLSIDHNLHPINKMYLLNNNPSQTNINPSEQYLENIQNEDDEQPYQDNQTQQQFSLQLDKAMDAFNNNSSIKESTNRTHPNNTSTNPNTNSNSNNNNNNNQSRNSKTAYLYPIDILFTKLQIQEALIEIKKNQLNKGCTLLTDAFECAPRFLGHDRMIILNLLHYIFSKNNLQTRLIDKQVLKFNKIYLKVSIIVNCDPTYLKRVSKQLYDIYQLSDTFSLSVVNEQVEQYIAPINQSNWRGKEGFINNIMKYLRYKHIQSNQQFFLSALIKASLLFQNTHQYQNNHTIQKKYILIFGDKDCIFQDALYKQAILQVLGQNHVKILVFNPQDDKEGSYLNIQCYQLPFKIRFFFKFFQLIDYFKKKSIQASYGSPFLIEKI